MLVKAAGLSAFEEDCNSALTRGDLLRRTVPFDETVAGGGGVSQKNWAGCAARFPKPLPYL